MMSIKDGIIISWPVEEEEEEVHIRVAITATLYLYRGRGERSGAETRLPEKPESPPLSISLSPFREKESDGARGFFRPSRLFLKTSFGRHECVWVWDKVFFLKGSFWLYSLSPLSVLSLLNSCETVFALYSIQHRYCNKINPCNQKCFIANSILSHKL